MHRPCRGDSSIDVTITDVGNLSGPMKMGMTGWAMAQYNRETDTGYERATMYGLAARRWRNTTTEASGAIFAADRFVVEVRGNAVTMDDQAGHGQGRLAKLAAAK